MDREKTIEEYLRVRYFFTVEEFLKKNNIVSNDDKIYITNSIHQIIVAQNKNKEKIFNLIDNKKSFQLVQGNQSIYFHPCTDKKHKYQLSYFNNDIAMSDIRRNTLQEIKRELSCEAYHYKIKEVI